MRVVFAVVCVWLVLRVVCVCVCCGMYCVLCVSIGMRCVLLGGVWTGGVECGCCVECVCVRCVRALCAVCQINIVNKKLFSMFYQEK